MKKNTNSMTEHSINLRNETAKAYIAKKRKKGVIKQISFSVDASLFDEIAQYRKENQASYADIFREFLSIKKEEIKND